MAVVLVVDLWCSHAISWCLQHCEHGEGGVCVRAPERCWLQEAIKARQETVQALYLMVQLVVLGLAVSDYWRTFRDMEINFECR